MKKPLCAQRYRHEEIGRNNASNKEKIIFENKRSSNEVLQLFEAKLEPTMLSFNSLHQAYLETIWKIEIFLADFGTSAFLKALKINLLYNNKKQMDKLSECWSPQLNYQMVSTLESM